MTQRSQAMNDGDKELREAIAAAMVCDDAEHLRDETGESCYQCQIDKVVAACKAFCERREREIETKAKLEQVMQDFHSMLGYDCFGEVDESALIAWRQDQISELQSHQPRGEAE